MKELQYAFDPRFQTATNPRGGSGILEVPIQIYFAEHQTEIKRFVAYTWLETVNGIEIDIKRPWIPNAIYLEEDIYNALKSELKHFDQLNFIKK